MDRTGSCSTLKYGAGLLRSQNSGDPEDPMDVDALIKADRLAVAVDSCAQCTHVTTHEKQTFRSGNTTPDRWNGEGLDPEQRSTATGKCLEG